MNFCFSVPERIHLCPIFSVRCAERRVPPKAFALCMAFCGDGQGLVFLHQLWPFQPEEDEAFTEWAVSPHQSIGPIRSIFRAFTSHFILSGFNFPSFSSPSLADEAAFLPVKLKLDFFSVLMLWSAPRRNSIHTIGNDGSNLILSPVCVCLNTPLDGFHAFS